MVGLDGELRWLLRCTRSVRVTRACEVSGPADILGQQPIKLPETGSTHMLHPSTLNLIMLDQHAWAFGGARLGVKSNV